MTAENPTPTALATHLEEAFIRYYETAFRVRDASIAEERRALMTRPGQVFAEPLIEPVPRYPATDSLDSVFSSVDAPRDAAEKVLRALFDLDSDTELRLRRHQTESVQHHFA